MKNARLTITRPRIHAAIVRSYSQSWPDLGDWLDDQKAEVRHDKLR